ncbi:BGTF surface domain-containing protein [Haloferax sp. DFSO52]|uniref:BGTF surface domain-containing protein n=1 Tax=Haloferax sp. DFSO52 TaxID=3388505 RepID=UPI003A8B3C94
MRPPHALLVLAFVLVVASAGVAASDGTTSIDYQGDELVLGATSSQKITGTTPFESGTVIGVRVKSVDGTHPFLVSKAVKVEQNGSFAVEFDLSELAPLRGGPVEVEIRRNESIVHEIGGTLVTENMPENSTLTFSPSTAETTTTETTTTAETTTTQTPTGPLSGISVPGLGITTGVVALLAVAFLVRR